MTTSTPSIKRTRREESRTCPGCGLPVTDSSEAAVVRNGERYRGNGCADGTGCTGTLERIRGCSLQSMATAASQLARRLLNPRRSHPRIPGANCTISCNVPMVASLLHVNFLQISEALKQSTYPATVGSTAGIWRDELQG